MTTKEVANAIVDLTEQWNDGELTDAELVVAVQDLMEKWTAA